MNKRIILKNEQFHLPTRFKIILEKSSNKQIVLHDTLTNTQIMLKQLILQSVYNVTQILQTLQNQKGLFHSKILRLIDYQYRQPFLKKQSILLFYEFGERQLSNQFNRRLIQQQFFAEKQLWKILSDILFAATYMQESNVSFGCISLRDMYTTQNNRIKLADPTLAENNPKIYQPGCYYSPEALFAFKNKQILDHNLIFKSDIFSLGMCMLELAILQPSNTCYCYEQKKLSISILQEKLKKLQRIYSQKLTEIVRSMLRMNPAFRCDFISLKKNVKNILSQTMLFVLNQSQEQITKSIINTHSIIASLQQNYAKQQQSGFMTERKKKNIQIPIESEDSHTVKKKIGHRSSKSDFTNKKISMSTKDQTISNPQQIIFSKNCYQINSRQNSEHKKQYEKRKSPPLNNKYYYTSINFMKTLKSDVESIVSKRASNRYQPLQ